ncbi:BTB/POZ domain-containing protein KCTD14 isoform X2 [Corythoichthys intestinalis]|uniref:BTB/POZ domain-containing protein KCTD14 isoform X2 n=1 Tax=Corythoichthys intestinalis TaxID=161448 RepID=UPI0025A5771A|nr:BTB/POZ domain-containing protein KCTD14 isoform X2 [Corythoichthys intestinalis]
MNQVGHKVVEENWGRASPHPSVIDLNVGGQSFCTSVETLTKYPESKLAEWFNGPPKLPRDARGHYFLDRDGQHFGAVLEFLRSGRLPVRDIPQVHKESVYYNVQLLTKRLEETPELFGELVGRQKFLARVPHYKENIEVLIRIARSEAVASRRSTVVICVLRTEEDLASFDDALRMLRANKDSVVTFGPWNTGPSGADLLECVKKDIRSQGYTVDVQPHVGERKFLGRSNNFFHTMTFTWW